MHVPLILSVLFLYVASSSSNYQDLSGVHYYPWEELHSTMKSVSVNSSLIASVVFLLVIGSTPVVFASTDHSYQSTVTTPALGHSNVLNPALTLVPVRIKFNPKTYTLPTSGGTVNAMALLENKGVASVTFTGCTLTINGESLVCSLSSFTLPGKSGSGFLVMLVLNPLDKGNYKVVYTLTGVNIMSHPGKFTIRVR